MAALFPPLAADCVAPVVKAAKAAGASARWMYTGPGYVEVVAVVAHAQSAAVEEAMRSAGCSDCFSSHGPGTTACMLQISGFLNHDDVTIEELLAAAAVQGESKGN